jgi:hypothetical protein
MSLGTEGNIQYRSPDRHRIADEPPILPDMEVRGVAIGDAAMV